VRRIVPVSQVPARGADGAPHLEPLVTSTPHQPLPQRGRQRQFFFFGPPTPSNRLRLARLSLRHNTNW